MGSARFLAVVITLILTAAITASATPSQQVLAKETSVGQQADTRISMILFWTNHSPKEYAATSKPSQLAYELRFLNDKLLEQWLALMNFKGNAGESWDGLRAIRAADLAKHLEELVLWSPRQHVLLNGGREWWNKSETVFIVAPESLLVSDLEVIGFRDVAKTSEGGDADGKTRDLVVLDPLVKKAERRLEESRKQRQRAVEELEEASRVLRGMKLQVEVLRKPRLGEEGVLAVDRLERLGNQARACQKSDGSRAAI